MMKYQNLTRHCYCNRFTLLAILLSGLLFMPACQQESSPVPQKVPTAKALAKTVFENQHFQALLEGQRWINAQVEVYMDLSGPVAGTAAGEIISDWAQPGYEFTNEDVELVEEIFGFSDEESFRHFTSEMSLRHEEVSKAFADAIRQLNEKEQETFNLALSQLVTAYMSGEPIPGLGADDTAVEFRRADCCCLEPNQCSWNVCSRLDECIRDAGFDYVSTIVGVTGASTSIGAGFAGIGSFAGFAFGLSASTIFGGVYYGYSVHECKQTANQGCRYCNC